MANNVIALKQKREDRKYKPDPIFFIKDQFSVGTVLIHSGRKDHSAWIVTRIINTNSRGARHLVDTVQKFDDRVYMKRSNGTASMAQRGMTFGYLCYSAIWRVG